MLFFRNSFIGLFVNMEKIKYESFKEKNGKGGVKVDEIRIIVYVFLDF